MLGKRLISLAVMALFLLMQGMAQAHIADHGHDHEHEGIPCAVVILAEEQMDDVLPPIAPESLTPRPTLYAHAEITCRSVIVRQTQGPSSRAPPA